MNNDLVRLACERAVQSFGIGDTFNAKSFAAVFAQMNEVNYLMDLRYVRAILTGRPDIEIVDEGFRLLSLDAVARRYRSYV